MGAKLYACVDGRGSRGAEGKGGIGDERRECREWADMSTRHREEWMSGRYV
jgi:hypothetical protein